MCDKDGLTDYCRPEQIFQRVGFHLLQERDFAMCDYTRHVNPDKNTQVYILKRKSHIMICSILSLAVQTLDNYP